MADTKWYDDLTVKNAFMTVLVEADVLTDTDDVRKFMDKPFRYNAAYAAWEEAEFPDSDSEDWDDFVEAISDDSDDEAEDNDEDEEEEEGEES